MSTRPSPTSGDQVGDAAGDDARLSGTCAGDDEQRAVAIFHCLALRRVQVGDQRVHVEHGGTFFGWSGTGIIGARRVDARRGT
jgi:hypothetical protein